MSSAPAVPEYKVLIGMEVHVQLATRSKMFSGAANGFGAAPNHQVDPVVLGLPGVLPVINRQAVEMAIQVGLALHCRIAAETKWDRKSYYYPDLPKNYQISQYEQPLCGAGELELPLPNGQTKLVRVRRAHLEEDAGKLLHQGASGVSRVDLNRAGTPLLEIVTEPDLASATEARLFGEELRRICRYLGISPGIMQQGHMRFEPNINLHILHQGRVVKTPITEIKNLNSFRALERACDYEVQRQLAAWRAAPETPPDSGKSTRGWDDDRGVTVLQREKEEAHDYRYFPDPDLVPLRVAPAWVERLRGQLVELPISRRRRYERELGLSAKEAFALTEERAVADLFEAAQAGAPARRLANLLLGPAAKLANERATAEGHPVQINDLPITAGQYAAVAQLAETGRISATAAASLVEFLAAHPGADPAAAAAAQGLLQVSDSATTEAWVRQALSANPRAVADYKNNPKKKAAALGFLRGAVMKTSQGKANPQLVSAMLQTHLDDPAASGTDKP